MTEANGEIKDDAGAGHNACGKHTDWSSTGGVSKRMRLVKTGCMITAGLAMGAPVSILGPAMLDLTELLQANFEQISVGTTVLTVGIIAGCFFGGVLCDKFRPRADLVIFGSSVIAGVAIGVVPWAPSLALFYILMVVAGYATGTLRTACFAMTNAMWENPSTPILVVFAGLTMGLLSPALVATPFLSEETDQIGFNGNTSTVVSTTVEDPENIRYMFAIIGVLMIVLGIPFIVFYLMGSFYSPRKKTALSVKETLSPHTYSPGRPVFGVVFITVLFFIITITYMKASIMGIFLFTVSVDDFGVSKKLSSGLLVAFFLMEIVGRLVFGFISKFVRIQKSVMILVLVVFLFGVALVTVGQKSRFYLWGLSLSQQFFSGALYASYVPWGNRYVEFTGVVTSISQTAIAGGLGIGAAISGSLYEHHGQEALWYFWLACAAGLVVLTVPLQVVAARFGERIALSLKLGDIVVSEENESTDF